MSGLSVFARQEIRNSEPARLAHKARYRTRPPIATERVRLREDGRLLLEIPADHRTGAEVLCLSPHELIHRLCAHIPDSNRHLVRYAGAYANQCRRDYRREAVR